MPSSKLPPLPYLFLKAALKSTLNDQQPRLPEQHFVVSDVTINRGHLMAYHRSIGWQNQRRIAPSYPQILAFKLHLQLLTASEFPFALMGLVHVRNSIEQYAAIDVDAKLTLSCHAKHLRAHKRGWLFDIVTEVLVNGAIIWKSTSTSLFRCQQINAIAPSSSGDIAFEALSHLSDFTVASETGRAYAKVSGDYNPIHLYPWTARMLGFPRHIAHGMWTKARCISEIAAALGSPNRMEVCRIDVEFKRPLFIPAPVKLAASVQQSAQGFMLRDASERNVHLQGKITPL